MAARGFTKTDVAMILVIVLLVSLIVRGGYIYDRGHSAAVHWNNCVAVSGPAWRIRCENRKAEYLAKYTFWYWITNGE